MSKRTRRSELPMLGVLFIAGVFLASAAVAVPPAINVVPANGSQGGTGTFSVTLTTNGAQVAGTENDIAFDPLTPVAVRTSGTSGNCTVTTTQACSTDVDCPILAPPFDHEACVGSPLHCAVTTGQSCTTSADCPQVHEPCVNQSGPACTVDSTIGKGGFFTFLPHVCSNATTQTCTLDTECTSPGKCTGACTPGTNCTGIRAVILAVDNLSAIPDGSTLYTCTVDVSSTATVGNDYALTISNESAGAAVCSNDATKACTTDANCTSPGTCTQVLISGVTGTSGTIHVVQPETSFLVCDVEPHTGDGLNEFGNQAIGIADVKSVFKAAQFGGSFLPAAGSARLSAMDAAPVDVPPACGGSQPASINIADVKQCFKRAQFSGQANFKRTITDSTCVSTQQ